MITIPKTLPCRTEDLGLIDYQSAFSIQKSVVEEVIGGDVQRLLFCEHPSVLTLGRLATEEHILWPRKDLEKRGVEVVRIDRGGEVTLHCPGQLVVYPVFDLKNYGKDLKIFLSRLEQVAIDLLRDFAIVANSPEDERGVWVNDRKIASIGVGVRKWVSYHGIALNVNTDLKEFDMIRPCGLDVRMTSMSQLKGRPISMQEVKDRVRDHFYRHFHLEDVLGGE